tara:strand:+ start:6232 stop:7659 length:1428 start_codon:yes stop_codon:yes gene_type:complete
MAKKDIDELAALFEAQLLKTSEVYRAEVSDYLPHEIHISINSVKAETRTQLRKIFQIKGRKALPKKYENVIKREVPKLCAYLYNTFNPDNWKGKGYVVSDLIGTKKDFTFLLAAKPGTRANVFSRFRKAKQEAQKGLIDALDAVMKEDGGAEGKRLKEVKKYKGKDVINDITKEPVMIRSSFLAIGHADTKAVATQRALKSQQIYSEWFNHSGRSEKVKELMTNTFGNQFVQVNKVPGKGEVITTVEVSLESDLGNKAKAASDSKRAGHLQEKLEQLAKLKSSKEYAELEGSDSPIAVVEKRMLNQLRDISKGRRASTNIRKQKINNSKTKGASKKSSAKQKTSSKFIDKGVKIGGAAKGPKKAARENKSSLPNVVQLVGFLNEKLPGAVERNMSPPRLQSRTGRFAASTKIIDVLATPKGLPSIGYTYQKNPYQTFEVGYKRGDSERDPRKLIDQSIREIMAQFAIGRFYTRRV